MFFFSQLFFLGIYDLFGTCSCECPYPLALKYLRWLGSGVPGWGGLSAAMSYLADAYVTHLRTSSVQPQLQRPKGRSTRSGNITDERAESGRLDSRFPSRCLATTPTVL
ncbi:hypothetical protein F4861DRAFT_382983 [Xylaria intraflava]|nr:hypothetical protein F4861DRAFT_382983 [Xylaria intraflava]